MRIIEQLVYKITGDNKEFDKSLDTSEKNTKKFGDVANKIFAGVTVTAVALAVKKLGELAISSATALDRIDKMSQKIGISRTSFQEWDFILSQSGASVDGLQMSLKTLATATEQADRGSKEYVDTFEQLGVSIYDTNGELKNQEQLFNEVFTALANTENQTKRTALASALLGRSATELSPAFNAGGEAIEAMRNQAHELGLVMEDDLIDQGVVLTDNIDQLKRAFSAWRTEALAPVIGVMVTVTEKLLSQKTATSEMASVLDTIKTKTAEYKTISDQLVNTQNNLSDAERDLLLARKETLAFEIQRQLVSLASSYNETKDNIVTLQEELGRLEGFYEAQIKYMEGVERTYDENGKAIGEWGQANDTLIKLYGELVGKQQELSNAQISYNGLISEASKLVADGVLDIEKLADVNSELYNKIIEGADAYTKQTEAVEKAQRTFKMLGDVTKEELEKIIEQNRARTDSAYYIELVRLAEEKLNNTVWESTDAVDENSESVNKAQEQYDKWIDAQERNRRAVRETNGEMTELTETVDELNEELSEHDKWLQEQERRLRISADSARELALQNNKGAEAEKELSDWHTEQARRARILADASREASFAQSKLNEVTEESNTSIMPDAQKQLDKWIEAQQRNASAIRETTGAFKSDLGEALEESQFEWESYSVNVASSIASMWNSINRARENANAQELQDLEELHEKRIEDAEEAGATEQELTDLRKDLQDELNDKKTELAKEDAKRQKEMSIFQVVLDTARAIMQIWADPTAGGVFGKSAWTAVAAGAGISQIAAINSQPEPSFDVGSIRVPETTRAIVHKDEMILTAPQAEQARREGITIAPTGGGSGNTTFMIYLDGKKIAENTVGHVNSGVYRIDARVVK